MCAQGVIKNTDVGVWAMVIMPEAAVVINPVARRLVEQMRNGGIEVEWVQQSLERWRLEKVDGRWRQTVVRQISVDLVLSVAGDGGRRDYWWVEMKWTRGSEEDWRSRVVNDGWNKVGTSRRF